MMSRLVPVTVTGVCPLEERKIIDNKLKGIVQIVLTESGSDIDAWTVAQTADAKLCHTLYITRDGKNVIHFVLILVLIIFVFLSDCSDELSPSTESIESISICCQRVTCNLLSKTLTKVSTPFNHTCRCSTQALS